MIAPQSLQGPMLFLSHHSAILGMFFPFIRSLHRESWRRSCYHIHIPGSRIKVVLPSAKSCFIRGPFSVPQSHQPHFKHSIASMANGFCIGQDRQTPFLPLQLVLWGSTGLILSQLTGKIRHYMNMSNDPMRVQSGDSRMQIILHDESLHFVCK